MSSVNFFDEVQLCYTHSWVDSSKQYFWFTDLITDMSMETVYAGTVEQLSSFVLQVGFAGAVVLTLVFLAAS